MAAFSPENNPKLQVLFNCKKYTFTQPAGLFPAAEVTVLGEAEPRTFSCAPLILTYDGAHCIYRGFMFQRDGKSSESDQPVDVALKWVSGEERVARLAQEAEIYETQLGAVQGVAVPKYYGFFTGEVESAKVACIILEWCNGPAIYDVRELNRQRMLAAIQLHKAGVMHSRILDPRHFLNMPDGTLRIVGFSSGKAHKCPGALPLTMGANSESRPTESCGELDVMESRYGVEAERMGRELRWANGLYPEFVSSFYFRY
ncbi:hypothetical protein C2E23DRAFT_880870 [Lenzites betulinus]|nr:hypothetical protein C2E23DRAFT_880870 [Lenzites betulinus]